MNQIVLRKALHHGLIRKAFYSNVINHFFLNCDLILDLGCGSGHFLTPARNRTKNSVGVDINKVSLDHCKVKALDVIRCDIFSLPLKENSFDGLFFSHVIEHIPTEMIHELFKEVHRILKSNLVIVTPTEHSKFWTEGHVVAYSKNKLEKLLQQEGYNVSRVCYDKCLVLGIKDRELMRKFFNKLPTLWLKMNIIAVANTTA